MITNAHCRGYLCIWVFFAHVESELKIVNLFCGNNILIY
ncbi:hypothetical protein PLIP_a1150 [Pseudoalteromonas lipolytica LMEB 39]|nr:hypothetical protein [Pseudoalteromonas lipolytica LMEB 39]